MGNLEKEVKNGKFRADLFYRLNVILIDLPPLRNRQEDIPLLSHYFIQKYCQQLNVKEKKLASETLEILAEYPWPGNVRELENSLESAVVLAKGETIRPEDLPGKIREKSPAPLVSETTPLTPPLEEIEKSYIFWVLNQTGWNKSKAASILGIDNSTLYRKIERYGLKEK